MEVLQSNIENKINSITSMVTNADVTKFQLVELMQGFTPSVTQPGNTSSNITVPELIKHIMNVAQNCASALLKTKFPSEQEVGSDCGLMQRYSPERSMTPIVQQLKNCFSDWALPAGDETIRAMAATIGNGIIEKAGMASSMFGTHYININQFYDWAVTYGLFTISDDNMGLVYAFSVTFNNRGFGN